MTQTADQLSLGTAIAPIHQPDIPLLEDHTELHAFLGEELFPTPDSVIEKMIEPHIKTLHFIGELLKCSEIFDPSAGTGAIFDYLQRRFPDYDSFTFIACEIEPHLRTILRDLNVSILGSDWLEFNESRQFPFILMNPPFSQGVNHVLKAWRHLSPDGHLTALLNAETIKNPCYQNRQELQRLIQLYGSSEFLGPVFEDSERPVNVDVVLIRLHKPKSHPSIDFEGFAYDKDPEISFEGFAENPLAHRDIVKSLVSQYEVAHRYLVERHHNQRRLNRALLGLETLHGEEENCLKTPDLFEQQLDAIKRKFWATVFTRSQIGKLITSNFKLEFEAYKRDKKEMAFTERNVIEVLEMYFVNRSDILQECIESVFDRLTEHHENCLIGAWKTNSSYKVNLKVIFPSVMTWTGSIFDFPYRGQDRDLLDDLDKVLRQVNGDSHICTIAEAIQKHISTEHGYISQGQDYRIPFESSYFEIKIFKKGTIHLRFKDERLWEEFNRRAALQKNWIGQEETGFGTQHYKRRKARSL